MSGHLDAKIQAVNLLRTAEVPRLSPMPNVEPPMLGTFAA
jgi:hypothetical protein